MGFGSAIAGVANSASNNRGMSTADAISFGGYGLDALMAYQQYDEASDFSMQQYANQLALQQAAANMAAQEQDYQNQMRQRLLGQTTNFADILNNTVAGMDPRMVVTNDDILNEETRLRGIYDPVMQKAIQEMISTQFARDINNGQDGMPTLQRKRAEDMINQIGDDVARQQEQVRQMAIGNIAGRADTVNASRGGALKEVSDVNLAQYNAELPLMGNGGSGYSSAISSGLGLYNTSANAASEAGRAFGSSLEDLRQFAIRPQTKQTPAP